MCIAVVSDIHGNLTALEAVITDLREASPDLVLHGGDLADSGARGMEVIDAVRALGWRGVAGNGEGALTRPETLEEFARSSRAPGSMWDAIREMMAATRERLGEERIAWLARLPGMQVAGGVALVHASPQSTWRAPGADAGDAELESVYGRLGEPIAVYGHIHRGFVRTLPGLVVANAGSVSLSYDGDCRAGYVLVEGSEVTFRRVEYDVEAEVRTLSGSGLPHWEWVAKMLRRGRPQLP